MAELNKSILIKCVDAYLKHGKNKAAAGRYLGVTEGTVRSRLKKAEKLGLLPLDTKSNETDGCASSCFEIKKLTKNIDILTKELNYMKKERMTSSEIRTYLFGLKDTAEMVAPGWLVGSDDVNKGKVLKEIPTMVLSDWHYGEVVKPNQVFGKNEYNLNVAHKRVKALTKNSINVMKNHILRNAEYPGVVIAFGGDMLSGDIHDELSLTNERPIMPTLLRLYEDCISLIESYHKEFGRVMIFCVPGNHSRKTKKTPFKDMNFTNFDWLLYNLLEKWFKNNPSVNFYIPDAEEALYRIYNHRFRLTHGHRFKGGMGYLGAISPITRGELKKRAASYTYDEAYDTLITCHYHQYMMPARTIVNGSLIGYNEFAIEHDFAYDVPKQALFLTHPEWGITTSAPIFCTEVKAEKQYDDTEWVSWRKDK